MVRGGSVKATAAAEYDNNDGGISSGPINDGDRHIATGTTTNASISCGMADHFGFWAFLTIDPIEDDDSDIATSATTVNVNNYYGMADHFGSLVFRRATQTMIATTFLQQHP